MRRWGAVIAVTMALLAAACGSSGGEEFPRVVTLGNGEIYAGILNSSLTVGPNRLVMEIATSADDEPLLAARVRLRFFDLNDDKQALAAEADARFVPVELAYIDEQSPGKPRETVGNDGAYVASVNFARAGDWGVKIAVATDNRKFDEIPFRFSVRERSDEPMIGDAAPPSVQATLANVASIEDIDSSYPPRPQMHDTTIADALAAGRPAVIAFATPAYCTSRLCAPVMDTIMDPLYQRYGASAAVIHVEPYELRDLRAGFVQNPVPAARQWNIHSEPWLFVVDRQGRIAAKFEGIMALDEVESALQAALAR